MSKIISSAVILGSGNVGHHLARVLHDRGVAIPEIYNRTTGKAAFTAKLTGSRVNGDIREIMPGADIYIFAVADSILPAMIRQFPHKDAFAVHTSGSLTKEIFDGLIGNHGVFYPLQTFSREVDIDFDGIPFCIEASTEENLQSLKKLAELVSGNVHEVNSEQRSRLHLAAVFACNFTNYLYSVSEDIVTEAGSDFELLRPLINETARKVMHELPHRVQTGPARRGDKEIIKHHMDLLRGNKDLEELYKVLTDQLRHKYRK